MKKTAEIFNERIIKKKYIEFHGLKKKSDVGEFWRYWEGVNIGTEISKDGQFKRVCLILHNNLGNGLLLIAPISTKYHEELKEYYIKIINYKKFGLKESRIILNQTKPINSKRLEKIVFGSHKSKSFSKMIKQQYVDLFL